MWLDTGSPTHNARTVAALRRGDSDALSSIVDRHAGALAVHLAARGIGPSEARVIAGHAFVELFRARRDLKRGTDLLTTLCTIADNLSRQASCSRSSSGISTL